jgi:predicted nucleic-acid-binding protein
VPDTSLIDANVILRYLLADHAELHAKAKALFDDVREGRRRVIVPEAVLAECVYVMQRLYGVPRSEIANTLTDLLRYRGVAGDEIPTLRRALAIYGRTRLGFADTLLAARAVVTNLPVITFDAALERHLAREAQQADEHADQATRPLSP